VLQVLYRTDHSIWIWNPVKRNLTQRLSWQTLVFFTPSTADTLLKECFPPEPFIATDVATGERHVTPNDLEGEELLAVSRCQPQGDIAHDSTAGAAASFVAPVLNSVAIGYVGHEIGKGIGNSGDRTSVNNNSSNENKNKNKNFNKNENENENENENDNYNKATSQSFSR